MTDASFNQTNVDNTAGDIALRARMIRHDFDGY
jgi:hypothetical protein